VILALAPILPSRDFDTTAAFYAALGFAVRSRWPSYLILAREAAELHFFAGEVDPTTSDRGVYLHLSDARVWSRELAALGLPADGIPRFVPAEAKAWGMVELAIVDPDGNLLRAGHASEAADG
jgi:catechol 2,3-dioxygenase-like lactoylglutathione lyase family enzyme